MPSRRALLAPGATQPQLGRRTPCLGHLPPNQRAETAAATQAASPIPGAAGTRGAVNQPSKSVVREIRTPRSVGTGGGRPPPVTRWRGVTRVPTATGILRAHFAEMLGSVPDGTTRKDYAPHQTLSLSRGQETGSRWSGRFGSMPVVDREQTSASAHLLHCARQASFSMGRPSSCHPHIQVFPDGVTRSIA
jgi:hypothetical protein